MNLILTYTKLAVSYLIKIYLKIIVSFDFLTGFKIKTHNNILYVELGISELSKFLSLRFLRFINLDLILIIKSEQRARANHKTLVTVSSKHIMFFKNSLEKIFDLYFSLQNPFILLVPTKQPPKLKTRFNDGKVKLILTNFTSEIESLVENIRPDTNLIKLCFNITKYVVDNKTIDSLIIRQFDDLELAEYNGPDKDKRLILPHKGNLDYLDTCLDFLIKNNNKSTEICACFDEEITNQHTELIDRYNSQVNFYKLNPHSVGPYVSRQLLAESSDTTFLTFQDSDDIPTFDRLDTVSEYINQNPDVDWFGCQSIRLNEFTEAIDILRYPIDVSEALNKSDDYCLLLPSSTIKKEKFVEVGGFSTVRKMATDRQFLYLSHIKKLNMKNIDKYLYLRRRRKHSLTMSADTGFGSDERSRLQELWKSDFDKVKKQKINLNQSSLIRETTQDEIEIIEIN